MIGQYKEIWDSSNLHRYAEDIHYNQNLYAATIFPYKNGLAQPKINQLVINFSFQGIKFNKRQTLPFFIALELLTRQKCVATLSSRDILAWHIQKGMIVGCKVTLRKTNLMEFLELLVLAMPRMEKIRPLLKQILKHKNTSTFNYRLGELVFFHPLELALGVNTDVKILDLYFLFNTLTAEEKIFLLSATKIPV